MYEILKSICAAQSWEFTYTRKDYQNLFDEVEVKNKPYIFLDPIIIEDGENDSGVLEEEIHSGDFMIVYSSDIDEEDYEARFEAYIKPILKTAINTIKNSIRCEANVSFNLWKKTEVINALDYNFDGIIVTYNITFEE